jgi:hypothetical protein
MKKDYYPSKELFPTIYEQIDEINFPSTSLDFVFPYFSEDFDRSVYRTELRRGGSTLLF